MAEALEKPRTLPYVSAINEAVREVLNEYDNSFVVGEDVAGAGGVYGYYHGLLDEYGPERMYDTPISEEGIIGLGVGAAATGCRPIVDLMFMDFMGECMDEIANQLAKMRYMFGGRATLPVTMLTMGGGRRKPGRSALPEPGSMDLSPSGPEGRHAHHALRRERSDHFRRKGRQPGDRLPEQDVAGHPGRGTGGVLYDPAG